MSKEVGACCGAPAPPPGGPGSAMWDKMAPWYTKHTSPGSAALTFSLFGHLGLLGDGAEKLHVVETHCADARAASFLLKSTPTASYTACDFSEGMLEAAKGRLGDLATICHADSMSMPFPDATFDRYVSNLGGCCVADINAKLSEARRIVKPGGQIAMSLRIEGGEGDTAFKPLSDALAPYGQPPPPDREGLHLGKDLDKLRAKWQAAGFTEVVAWNTWITLPVHNIDEWMEFATGPMAMKVLSALEEEGRRAEAREALRKAGEEVLAKGAVQIAAVAVVARVPA
eukprot:TRINITY_DN38668_c0_g1_i1.p1 TRINITY_DN38668_c0_g1~~TRINITY_DN38668_c0_g1_i1.p1  ORF type:complete len:285 (-),score=47.77 TRINITY_DN38668_c0_g1_i1:103-957(-)